MPARLATGSLTQDERPVRDDDASVSPDANRQRRTQRAATTRAALLFAALGLSLGCGGPFFLIPGGELSGEVVPAPVRDWSFVDAAFVDLETRPSDPYSVELNYFVRGGLLYIDAADVRKWRGHLQADRRVRVRFDGRIYPLEAVLVGRPGELSTFDPERFVYRLDARGGAGGGGADQTPAAIRAALEHPDRPLADRNSDASRKPAEVLALAGVVPGMRIADLMAGGGWYSEILARSVGPTGHVYAQNNAIDASRRGADLDHRLTSSGLGNAESLERELESLEFAEGQLSAVFMTLAYHDTYWMKADRAEMNRQIFAALEPGGVFCLVDHRAATGAGERDSERLHRGDAAMIRHEVEGAGFVLITEAEFLANPEDDRSRSVFDPAIRGKTDRFLLLFRKPV